MNEDEKTATATLFSGAIAASESNLTDADKVFNMDDAKMMDLAALLSKEIDAEFVKKFAAVLIAFAITAIFRWFVMPKLNLVPNEDGSGFFFQALMIVVVVSIFVGSLLLGQYIIGVLSN